jgi:hypothetical protein
VAHGVFDGSLHFDTRAGTSAAPMREASSGRAPRRWHAAAHRACGARPEEQV